MKIAVITGASSGLGEQFALRLCEHMPEIDCVWLIARRGEKLKKVAESMRDVQVKILPLDLCSDGGLEGLKSALEADRPEVWLLVNNAGCGYLGNLGESGTEKQTRMVDLNVRALTAVTDIVIPYIPRGGHIINVSSIASFYVNPRMTVYSASKAYVSAFTRGAAEELREKGIGVTAVCPGPMKTEFLDIGGITGRSKMFETLPYSEPRDVVDGTYRAALKGKVIYTPGAFFKLYRVLAKILPHAVVVKFSKT